MRIGLGVASLAGVVIGLGVRQMVRGAPFSFEGRTVVIAGGSRGLGLVLARELAAEGARLVLLARNTPVLERAASELAGSGAEVLPITCDLRQEVEVNTAIQRAVEHFGSIDVLINNAGIIQVGPLEHMTVEDFEEAMAIHFYAPLYCTLATLPHMKRQGGGRIVNISSVGGKVASPHLAPYCASKFALVGLSEALRPELRRENIWVTTVCPGLMRTGSPRNAFFKGRHRSEYAWFTISDSLPLLSMSAEWAARQIIEACRRGKAQLVIGVHTQAAVLLDALFPEITAGLKAIANRLLPGVDPNEGVDQYAGHQSESEWAPSFLTRLTENAAARNNEL
jgi:short-subunit dehydrogenase